jgi:hypothetical protein
VLESDPLPCLPRLVGLHSHAGFFTPASHSDREKLKDCRSSAIKTVQACHWSILALWTILGSLSAGPRSRAFAAFCDGRRLQCSGKTQFEHLAPDRYLTDAPSQVDLRLTRPDLGGAVAKSWARGLTIRVSTAPTALAALFQRLATNLQDDLSPVWLLGVYLRLSGCPIPQFAQPIPGWDSRPGSKLLDRSRLLPDERKLRSRPL